MFRELDKTPSAEQLAAVFEEVLSVPDAPPDVAPTPGVRYCRYGNLANTEDAYL